MYFLHENETGQNSISTSNNASVPAGMYLLKVNNKNTRTRCEICSELTIKTINSGQKTHLGKIIKTLFKTSLTSRCF